MRKALTVVALAAITVFAASGLVAAQATQAPAQAKQAPANVDEMIEQIRKDARTDVNALIGASMNFTSDEAAKFWPLYKNYEAKRKTLNDERFAIIKDYAATYETMSDAKATELVQRSLALEDRLTAAKREFLAELQKALPGKTAARFYQVHNRIDILVDLMLAEEIPLVK
jgi:hypothetical protein